MRTLGAALLATMLVCSCSSVASAQIPDTPAGHQMSGWLAAFNSGARDSVRAFYEQNYPAQVGRVDQLLDFREGTGGFDFLKVVESRPTHIVAYVKERASDQIAEATFDVDSAPPHRITGMGLRAIDRPAEMTLTRLDQDSLVKAARARAEEDAAAGRFSGAVLIAQNGRTLLQSAYGLADRARGTPNTLETRFRIGSMNKMFTATAVLQLVQAGKVKLDAPLATYLPDYPNKEL